MLKVRARPEVLLVDGARMLIVPLQVLLQVCRSTDTR